MKRCSEAFRHGPADRRGRCPWCRQRCTSDPAPASDLSRWAPSALRVAYDLHYDPDFGAMTSDQIRDRYRQGRET